FNRRFDLRGLFPRLLHAAVSIGKHPESFLRMAAG
ncbi:MAG: IS1595 family transposase, partial [Trichloromonas sp.]|nr:IS1595 family transposase [Trichloromonas sp.]